MRLSLLAFRGGIGTLLSTLFAVTVMAQSAPTLGTDILTKAGALSADERSRVTRYVNYWADRLTPLESSTDRLTQVQRATRALGITVLNFPGITPSFREAYSSAMMPHLREILASNDQRASVSAMYIAARVGTDPSVGLLIDQIEHVGPLRRNAAAAHAQIALRDMLRPGGNSVSGGTVTTLLRVTADQAMVEENAIALQRELELLNELYTTGRALPSDLANVASEASRRRVEVLGARAERLDDNIIEIDAVDIFLRSVRSAFLADAASQVQSGPRLATHITQILEQAYEQWNEVDDDPVLAASYTRLIADAENFLKVIDRSVRRVANPPTPDTALVQSWDARNQQNYAQDLQEWKGLMQMPPYRAR